MQQVMRLASIPPHEPECIDARTWLQEVAIMALRASQSEDPRVIALAIALLNRRAA